MLADRRKQRGEVGAWLQSHSDRQLPVEVAAVDGGVMNIMQAVASWRQIFLQGAQQAGLAAAGLAGHNGRRASFQCRFQTLARPAGGVGFEHLTSRSVLAERRGPKIVWGE